MTTTCHGGPCEVGVFADCQDCVDQLRGIITRLQAENARQAEWIAEAKIRANDFIDASTAERNQLTGKIKEQAEEIARLREAGRQLVETCVQESIDKHATNPLRDDYLNRDYHLEITLAVGEMQDAAKVFGVAPPRQPCDHCGDPNCHWLMHGI